MRKKDADSSFCWAERKTCKGIVLYGWWLVLLVIGMMGCQKGRQSAPQISEISFLMHTADGRDSTVAEAIAGLPLTIRVKTDADMCAVWPAGDRVVMISVIDPAKDSMDNYSNVVLVRSDDYRDYGLTGARGKLMTGNKNIGYSLKYTYNRPGMYVLTVVATKNGVSSGSYTTTAVKKSLVVK